MINMPVENSSYVLGCLLKNPSLLKSKDYKFDVNEFDTNTEKILYSCIYNMYKSGFTDTISSYQLLEYLKNFNSQWYAMYTQYDNGSYIDTLILNANLKNFEYHYNRFKKFILLRELELGGWDIRRVYDETNVNTQLNMEFESKTIDELLSSLFNFNHELKKKWYSNLDEDSEMTDSSDGLDELLLNFKSGQTFGVRIKNPVLNSISKGAREGKIFLLGAGSGLGKSRLSIANACHLSMPFVYNRSSQQWEVNGMNEKVLVITTELLREEVQAMMLACVSNINENRLNYFYNELTEDEKNRLEKASMLLKQYPIQICHLPNYNLDDLEIIIEEYVLKYNTKFIFFDYVHLTAKIIEQLKGVGRDIALLQIMTALKNIANKYGCFIWVGSQLNRSSNQSESKDTQGVFANAYSLMDKVDLSLVVTKPTSDDIDKLFESLKHVDGFRKYLRPNLIQTVIKNRGGQNAIRIWAYFNHGTLEEEVVAVTDLENNPISIDIINQAEGNIENYQTYLDWLNSTC